MKRSRATLNRLKKRAAASADGDDVAVKLTAPSVLKSKAARQLWDHITSCQAVDESDVLALTILCQTWQHYLAKLDDLEHLKPQEQYHELYNADNELTGTKPHALYQIVGDLRSQMVRQLDKFPLSPASKAKIGSKLAEAPQQPQERDRK